ncbi:MAG TPA: metallopeptidase TldD-related protein [Terracidiphilus sp.]|nr:metallopeptidase TldD-related protein [Terracidiphilus sp.]
MRTNIVRANHARLKRIIAGLGLAAACLFSAQAATAQTRADAEKDPVLKAMLQELDRSASDLRLKGFAKPFFIQYRIEDADDFETRAEFGATEGSSRAHQRVARVTVRVGDARTDSSGLRGDGALEIAALDNDPIALRSALWQATDQAYKNALAAYAQKQAELKEVQTPPQANDFSQEKPIISLADPACLKVDEQSWTERMAAASGVYRTSPAVSAAERDIQYSTASFHARATTTWIVSSEGAIVRKGATEFEESFGVGTQAADGMHLDRSYASTGRSAEDLDSPEAFTKHEISDIESLAALRKAPVVEDEYHGPVLLSADASTDTLRELLSTAVIATRPALGTEIRTNGPFASSFQERVLPPFLGVVDDPGLTRYDGKGLIGAYDVDDEGVPAQRVELIRAGHLVNYLIGRQPVKDFPQSNGHGRAGIAGAARPSISVLKISAQSGLSDAELNQKLMELMKEDGLKYVYYVETLAGAGNPRLLYRIYPDGTRQLVRGAELDDVDERAMRSNVAAAGRNLDVANYFGDIPQTVLAPALLLDDATIRRTDDRNEKLPFYPPPQ